MAPPISSMSLSLQVYFDTSIDSKSKIKNCRNMLDELTTVLRQFSASQIIEYMERRGADFLTRMVIPDPWGGALLTRESILEEALRVLNYNLSQDALNFLFNYYIQNSADAKSVNMNILHLLSRHLITSDVSIILIKVVDDTPDLLNGQMRVSGGLGMNPVELFIANSNDESMIYYMINKFHSHFGLNTEDKNRFLSAVNKICNPYNLDLQNRLINYINAL